MELFHCGIWIASWIDSILGRNKQTIHSYGMKMELFHCGIWMASWIDSILSRNKQTIPYPSKIKVHFLYLLYIDNINNYLYV